MKVKTRTLLIGASLSLFMLTPFILSADVLSGRSDSVDQQTSPYSCVNVPRSIVFCGDTVDLTRYDRHERMDRELLAFSYMHSTSIQTIKRANRYFPMIEPILKECGIPDDFKYLMAIESGANPFARSHAGASGLWQIMPTPGKQFGLVVNNYIDERYDVEKSTRAACKYFKEAYDRFGDWISVAASYNAGQGRISQQRKKQYTDTMLDLRLVEETARYVYRIFAIKMLFNNPRNFGFYLKASDLYPIIPCRKIKVSRDITDLARWAKSQGTTYALLRDLNPWIRNSQLHCHGETYTILIPDQEGMHYNPHVVIPHDRRWVVE